MEQLKFLASFFATENEFYEWGYNINDPMTQPLFFSERLGDRNCLFCAIHGRSNSKYI